MNKNHYDCVIIGSGPAGLGAAFHLKKHSPEKSIVILEQEKFSTGGLRNDCKMNFTYPIGFPDENWNRKQADYYLNLVMKRLDPPHMKKKNMEIYEKRAENLGVKLLNINQAHLGTDGGLLLIKKLMAELKDLGVEISTGETAESIESKQRILKTGTRKISFTDIIAAPGRKGFSYLQTLMKELDIYYIDNVVDIGVRVETRIENYPIVKDYYDPKFLFPDKVRTFCTNSGAAYVVQEQYKTSEGDPFTSVNGHAWADKKKSNDLVNFALLKTVNLTKPLASGQRLAEMLGMQAFLLGGGKPIMQRVGDFRLGHRSRSENFTGDLYNFSPTLPSCTPGDISQAMPSKILRAIWKSMKQLDTIIPGVLHPSTIIYYPEIKLYANKPRFINEYFAVAEHIYMAGDGAGTSRGITAAWASGIRAAEGILKSSG